MNVAAVLSPLWADPDLPTGENPLACELRVNNPSIAIISEEEDWSGDVAKYGTYLRQVIEYAIAQGVVPILATKADNLEGGNRIDALIAEPGVGVRHPALEFLGVGAMASHARPEQGRIPSHPRDTILKIFISTSRLPIGAAGWNAT